MIENIWFNYFVFGTIITLNNYLIKTIIRENTPTLSLIGVCLLGCSFFGVFVYELAENSKEGVTLFYSLLSVNGIYLLLKFFERKKEYDMERKKFDEFLKEHRKNKV